MAEGSAQGGAVASPCIDICRIGADGLCEGCLRSPREIAAWPALDDESRRALIVELRSRRTSVERKQA